MTSRFKLSIRSRLLASLLILLLLAIGLTGTILLRDAEKHIDDFRQTQVKFQAKTLAEGSLDALVSEDFEILERLIASSMPSKEYAYATLVRPNGQVLTHTNISLIGRTISTPSDLKTTLVRNLEYSDRPVREAIYPAMVGSKHLANAHVAYYMDLEYKQESETTLRLIIVLLICTILIMVGIYYITKILIDPIRRLTASVSEFSIHKNITIEKDILNRTDELGSLSSTFQNLFQRLAASYKELDEKRRELEDRVKERTQDLQHANDDLQKSESHVKAIMEHVADAVVSINADGIIQSFNTSAEALFGYPRDYAIGQSVNILMPESYANEHNGHINNYLSSEKPTKLGTGARELSGRHKNGSIFPMEISINVLVAKDNHIFIAVMRDITERKKEFDKLHFFANHDALTGLYNRKFFMQELERAIARAQRADLATYAVLYIDLDKFKYINDTMGHGAGDHVLCNVAEIMEERTRKSDIVARLGGDEFAVILCDTAPEQAEQVADSFRIKLEKYKYTQDGHAASIGCSIGIAIIYPDYYSADDVLADADSACYEAKNEGRNRVCVFDKNKNNDSEPRSADSN